VLDEAFELEGTKLEASIEMASVKVELLAGEEEIEAEDEAEEDEIEEVSEVTPPEAAPTGPEELVSEEDESSPEATLEDGSEERLEAVSKEVEKETIEDPTLCGLALDPFSALEERELSWHEAKRTRRDKPKMSFWPLRFIAGYFTKWASGFQLIFLVSRFFFFSMGRNSIIFRLLSLWPRSCLKKGNRFFMECYHCGRLNKKL